MNRKEIKILITFFIIYSFFVYWDGWDEEGHLSLVKSIVYEGRIQTDNFYEFSGDRYYFNGHYYSPKPPALALLSVPPYAISNLIYFNVLQPNITESPIIEVQKRPSLDTNYTFELLNYKIITPFESISRILVTIFTSCLFSALSVVLMYKFSDFITDNEKQKILFTVTYGLGTMVLPSAIVYTGFAVSAFFSFLSFYILFKIKHKKLKGDRYFFLSGIILCLGFLTRYSAFIYFLLCFVYIFFVDRKKIFIFILF